MNTMIYKSKIITFDPKAIDALKAAACIDAYTGTHVMIFDDVVIVAFNTKLDEFVRYCSIDEYVTKCTDILKEYNIEYKIKEMKF